MRIIDILKYLPKEKLKKIKNHCEYLLDNTDYLNGMEDKAIEDIDFSRSLYNTLKSNGINHLSDIFIHTYEELSELPTMGEKRMNELSDYLKFYRIKLRRRR